MLPTGQDLLEWLEVFAHVRGGSFNDDESPPFTEMAETDQREKLHRKPPDQRTSWEEKFMRGFIREEEPKLRGHSAVVEFGEKYQETWHYQGKGVKLGDANTAICWYRPPRGPEVSRRLRRSQGPGRRGAGSPTEALKGRGSSLVCRVAFHWQARTQSRFRRSASIV